MEIKSLRNFLVVAREGSISAAALSLGIAQPTLSRQIHLLEEDLGVELFRRKSHHIVLTCDGEAMQRRALEIIEMIDRTADEFKRDEIEISGDIHIVSSETHLVDCFAPAICRVSAAYPKVKFCMHTATERGIIDSFRKGSAEFGFFVEPANIYNFNYMIAPGVARWGVITRKDNPLAKLGTVSADDLKSQALIVPEQFVDTSLSRNDFINWFGGDLSVFNIVGTMDFVRNALYLTWNGMGCIVALEGLLGLKESQDLCFIPLEPKFESKADFVWKNYRNLSPAGKIFLAEVKKDFAAS